MSTATLDRPKKASSKKSTIQKKSMPSVSVNSQPSGSSGLQRSNGIVFEEFNVDLQGQRAHKIWKEMADNDPIVGAMLFAIDMFMRKVQWFIDPASEEQSHVDDARFLQECKDDMSHTWPDFISEVNSMLIYGWAWFETLFKMRSAELVDDDGNPKSKFDDGKIGWRKFEIRSQDSWERWEFDDEGGILGMYQRPAPEYRERFIPISKSLLFRTTSRKNNPEGRSTLRNVYRPWYFKKRIEEIEGIGVERDLAGLPFAEMPAQMLLPDASEADKATVQSVMDLLRNVRRDEQEGVIWPQAWDKNGNKMYEFKLMNSGGTRTFSTDQIITRYEQRMAMTMLTDFILLGNDSTGSFALSTSKAGMFQAVLASWLDIIQDVLNNYAIPRLFRANGQMQGPYPKFRHDDVQQPSLADLATFVAALAGAGAQLFPDVNLENHMRRLAQLPLRDDTDKVTQVEDELRDQQIATQLEESKARAKLAKNPPPSPMEVMQGKKPVLGKQPGSVAGAPTKTTGKVKSKLPPQSRRRTAAVNASENVTKHRRVVRVHKKTLAKIR